jgi:hypothetical protein
LPSTSRSDSEKSSEKAEKNHHSIDAESKIMHVLAILVNSILVVAVDVNDVNGEKQLIHQLAPTHQDILE